MEPRDRIETLVKTKFGVMKERLTGETLYGGTAFGAHYQVPATELHGLLSDWPAAPKKTAEPDDRALRRSERGHPYDADLA